MKKISYLFLAFTFFFTSCEGPQGPPGLNGGLILANSFEIALDFTDQNGFSFVEPYGFPVFPSDVTLVYILWDTISGQDIWRLLPQTIPTPQGELIYNYDFTDIDVRFFLEGNLNFGNVDPFLTRNQVFRVVVVPADNLGQIDLSNFDNLVELYGIEEFPRR